MKYPLYVALLLTAACQLESGVARTSAPIIDGELSAKGSHPEVVYLWLGNASCTGTLIAPQVVLTARHCVEGIDLGVLNVFFGEDPGGSSGTWVQAADYIYASNGDIALIALSRPGPVEPVPYRRDTLWYENLGNEVLLVGFGDAGADGAAGVKREGITQIDELSGDLIYVGQTGSRTCFGDSGGPTFLMAGGVKYVVGVSSFVTSTDCSGGVSGNVRPDYYSAWIDAYVAEHSEGGPSCATDAQCATGCGGVADPDCPCSADDGVCSAMCQNFADNDPDCAGCARDDTCQEGCPVVDPDCCGADSICNYQCDNPDPDCSFLGDTCVGDDECQTQECRSIGDESRCTSSCDGQNACPSGFTCIDDTACWPEDGGCRFSQSPAPGALFAMALFLGLGALRRRRRRV